LTAPIAAVFLSIGALAITAAVNGSATPDFFLTPGGCFFPNEKRTMVVTTVDIDFDGAILLDGRAVEDLAAVERHLSGVKLTRDEKLEIIFRPNPLAPFGTVLHAAEYLAKRDRPFLVTAYPAL
jgi:hypothetical protein